MREIREVIFRGKRTDNGELVEGILFNAKEDTFIIPHGNEYSYDPIEGLAFDVYGCKVDPETVGQYTGLTDKNGVKIFEGDILKSTIKIIDYADVGFSISHYDEEDIGIVEWRKYGFMIAHKSGTWARSFYGSENYVIGNIHDNPEILKGGGENG